MNELVAIDRDPAPALEPIRAGPANTSNSAIDWRGIAERRLDRLVEAESDFAKLRERMDKVLQDHRSWIADSEIKLQSRLDAYIDAYNARVATQISELEGVVNNLHRQRDELRLQCSQLSMRYDEIVKSRSWRIMAPLRILVNELHVNHEGRRKILIYLSKVRGARAFGRAVLEPFPNLKSKLIKIIVSSE